MKLSSPVEMQPSGEGRERRGRGVVVGCELACYGPELHACGVRSETALRRRSAPRGWEVEWRGLLTGCKWCALIEGSGVVA